MAMRLQTPVRLVACLGLSLFMASCGGELAYQTGAGADQLARDRQACKTAGNPSQCLKDKGWAIASLADAEQPAANRPAGSVTMPQEVGASPAPGPAPLNPPALQADPLQLVTISGWAHFGGGSPDRSIEDCVASLGTAHRPDPVTHQVTQALLVCMRSKNWRAL